jgi:hypothetical protein
MKFPLLVLLVALTSPATAQTAPASDTSAEAAAVARGWIRKEPGVWTRAEGRDAQAPYHADYMRRGCRVEEDWDGKKYTAMVSCARGVKPD